MVVRPDAWGAEVLATGRDRGLVEGFDLAAIARRERHVRGRDDAQVLGRLKAGGARADPKIWLSAATEAARLAKVHHRLDAQGGERFLVEGLGAGIVADAEGDVIEAAHDLSPERAPYDDRPSGRSPKRA